MEYDPKNDQITFASGRTVYSYSNSWSPSGEGEGNDDFTYVYYGSDGGFRVDGNAPEYQGNISHADAVEIADEMLKAWALFRAHHASLVEKG